MQFCDALDMHRLREHVDGLGFNGFEAAVLKDAEVAGQGRGITRHVDDALRAYGNDRPEQRFIATFSRRIDDDDVGAVALLRPARDDFFRLSDGELELDSPLNAAFAFTYSSAFEQLPSVFKVFSNKWFDLKSLCH
jgi:hypothetical protein